MCLISPHCKKACGSQQAEPTSVLNIVKFVPGMNIKCWQVIRDDSKRTFEVCGTEDVVNHFTNAVHGMQRAGMNVSAMTPPVTNKVSHKGAIIISGYTPEDGLYKRLMAEYMERTRREFEE